MNIKTWIDKNINKDNFINKNVFITGGNSGIGFELASHLASLNSNIFILCRNTNKGEDAKNKILEKYPNTNINVIKLDLSDSLSIKECFNNIKNYKIDYFVNNAGTYHLPKSMTRDGIEITMGTNYIGTFYLNFLLLNQFKNVDYKMHILFESSIISKYSKINYNDFFMDKKYSKVKIYARSKLAINNLYKYLINEYKDNPNLTFDLTHPGISNTSLFSKGYKNKIFYFIASNFMKIFFHNPSKASLTMLYALNKDTNTMAGPRGLFEFSGFPKNRKFKFEKDGYKSIDIAANIIKKL